MKTILTIMLAIATLAIATTTLTVTWDPMPMVDGFNLYAGDSLVGTVDKNMAEITIPDATTSLTVAAFNLRGEGPRSEPLIIPALPPKVKAYVVTVEGKLTITIKPVDE